jgi:hypothetical protein
VPLKVKSKWQYFKMQPSNTRLPLSLWSTGERIVCVSAFQASLCRGTVDSSSLLRLAVLLSGSARFGHRAGNGKASEQQIAMIAQKVIDAKHAQKPGRPFIASAYARASALRTTLAYQVSSPWRLFVGVVAFEELLRSDSLVNFSRARKSSISRPMRSEVSCCASRLRLPREA